MTPGSGHPAARTASVAVLSSLAAALVVVIGVNVTSGEHKIGKPIASSFGVLLANSYFVPDDLSVRTIVEARARGVDVEIIVPGAEIDSEITRAASRRRWAPLLEAGVAIYEFQPTMFH